MTSSENPVIRERELTARYFAWVMEKERLTNVEALEVLFLRKGDVDFVGRRVLACSVEGEGEGCDLAGAGLHGGRRRGVGCDGEEAEDDGKGEGFHGEW